ncbi:MAG: hypothetical protein ACLFTV_15330, partial [Desulfococcaceae bacterium]
MILFQDETADQKKDDAQQNSKDGQHGKIEDDKQQAQYQKDCAHGDGRHFFDEQFFGHHALLSSRSPFRLGKKPGYGKFQLSPDSISQKPEVPNIRENLYPGVFLTVIHFGTFVKKRKLTPSRPARPGASAAGGTGPP